MSTKLNLLKIFNLWNWVNARLNRFVSIRYIVLWPLQGLFELRRKKNKTFQFSLQSFSSDRKKKSSQHTQKRLFWFSYTLLAREIYRLSWLSFVFLHPPHLFLEGILLKNRQKIPSCRFSAAPLVKKNFIPIIFQGSFTLISRLSPKVPSDISTSTHFTRAWVSFVWSA